MIIAVIEDDDLKCGKIVEFLKEAIPESRILIAKSYKSGLRLSIQPDLDLIILDMTLPSFDISADEDGGPPLVYGGRELLRQMKRRNVRAPVIVVTQYEQFESTGDVITLGDLTSEMSEEFPELFVGSVYYNPTQSRWRDSLRNALSRAKGRI